LLSTFEALGTDRGSMARIGRPVAIVDTSVYVELIRQHA
jgi:hypothetical protein